MANNFERTLGKVGKCDGTLSKAINEGMKSRRTGNDSEADRYIPFRTPGDSEISHFLLTRGANKSSASDVTGVGGGDNSTLGGTASSSLCGISLSDEDKEYQRRVAQSLNISDKSESRILAFTSRAAPQSRKLGQLLMDDSKPSKLMAKKRLIPHASERVLDAPDTINDYYLNTLHWSDSNLLAVALANNVYVWNAATGNIKHLMECGEAEEYICSLRWYPKQHSLIGVGTSLGRIQIWDAEAEKLVRTMHAGGDTTEARPRIPSLAWNGQIVSSGSRFGRIRHHDLSAQRHEIANFAAHEQVFSRMV